MFGDIYNGRRVLITGHTGFKGSWLSFWLKRLGAHVCGIALPPESEPNHYQLLKPAVRSVEEDIRNREVLDTVFSAYRPEIVFHLAAQPIVRKSYKNPLDMAFAISRKKSRLPGQRSCRFRNWKRTGCPPSGSSAKWRG